MADEFDYNIAGNKGRWDLNAITNREYRAMYDATQPVEEGDATLAKASGLSAETVGDLGFNDYRMLFASFLQKCREPLDNPN